MHAKWGRMLFFAVVWAAVATQGFGEGVPRDENLVALFSDLHITPDPKTKHQREGLSRCVSEVLALNPRPANVLLYGDLAFSAGATNDYRTLKTLLQPLDAAGVRWHAGFGNHDRRAAFFSVFPERRDASPVPGRLVSVVQTPCADFILLDSCLEGPVNGAVDLAQRTWLAAELARGAKPVFVGAHHPIGETGVAEALTACARVKGYVYGHEHTWKQQRVQGVDTLCLPSTGHWGDIGYVLVKLSPDEATFTLHQWDCYAPRPAQKPEEANAQWRARTLSNNGSQWRVILK